jgi:TolB protein
MRTHFSLGLLTLPLLALAAPSGGLEGYHLLVTSVRTGNTEIFEVDPASGDARNVTRSRDCENRYPCWSPDGRQIAFTSNREGGTYNLFVCDADGSNVRALTHERGAEVAYMPSWVGDRIVFGLHREQPEIASIHPDGSGLTILGRGHDPCLSPDGTKIAYTGEVTGGVSVFVMDADGSNKTQILKEANPWGAIFPSWSPDGKTIVYSFKSGAGLELFLIDAAGQRPPRQLTHLNKVCTPAAFSPDGKWISFRCTDEMYWRSQERMEKVYSEKPGDKRPVWVIRPAGTDAHVIEPLRYQCSMDGSGAAWKPLAPSGNDWAIHTFAFRVDLRLARQRQRAAT